MVSKIGIPTQERGNETIKKSRVPKLRFPEFRDVGEWEEAKFGDKEVSEFIKDRIPLDQLDIGNYIKAELALMEELVPLLKKLAQGRDISGLSAYE